MGNCQTADAASLVIQHPSGRTERLYWAVTASEVMRTNPGHYVSLVIPLPNNNKSNEHNSNSDNVSKEEEQVQENKHGHEEEKKTEQLVTRVKLLRPSETLLLGHAYRLVTTQEVMKVLKAKKQAKMKAQQQQTEFLQHNFKETEKKQNSSAHENTEHRLVMRNEIQHRQRTQSTNNSCVIQKSSKTWRPSLHSISES